MAWEDMKWYAFELYGLSLNERTNKASVKTVSITMQGYTSYKHVSDNNNSNNIIIASTYKALLTQKGAVQIRKKYTMVNIMNVQY